VLRALSRSKPKAPGALGTVWIEFVLAQSGALAEARVKTPSGKPVLDEAALDAVRRARFPVPPAGLSASQLTFAIPYYFR
jgi:protein TonB